MTNAERITQLVQQKEDLEKSLDVARTYAANLEVALYACIVRFDDYAHMHRANGKEDKALSNQKMADAARSALKFGTVPSLVVPQADGED